MAIDAGALAVIARPYIIAERDDQAVCPAHGIMGDSPHLHGSINGADSVVTPTHDLGVCFQDC
jgi:hypothetical protein